MLLPGGQYRQQEMLVPLELPVGALERFSSSLSDSKCAVPELLGSRAQPSLLAPQVHRHAASLRGVRFPGADAAGHSTSVKLRQTLSLTPLVPVETPKPFNSPLPGNDSLNGCIRAACGTRHGWLRNHLCVPTLHAAHGEFNSDLPIMTHSFIRLLPSLDVPFYL